MKTKNKMFFAHFYAILTFLDFFHFFLVLKSLLTISLAISKIESID